MVNLKFRKHPIGKPNHNFCIILANRYAAIYEVSSSFVSITTDLSESNINAVLF